LHLLICIIAALVFTVGFIVHELMGSPYGLFNMALWVSTVIVGFYFLGHITRSFLINRVFMQSTEEELLEAELEDAEGIDETEAAYGESPELMTDSNMIEPAFDSLDDDFYSGNDNELLESANNGNL